MGEQKKTQASNEPQLKKNLSPMSVWAIALGCIIGWGSFINPGKKFLPNSGVAGTAIAMLLGALVMIIIAYSYAYMVPKCPKAGGEFVFTKMCYGKSVAFLCGWFLFVAFLTNVPMNSTALGLIVDGLDGDLNLLRFGYLYEIAGFEVYLGEMLFAMAIIILFGYLNIVGVKVAGFVQTILAGMLIVCAFTLCGAGLFSAKANGINMEPIWGFDKAAMLAAGVGANADDFARVGTSGILSAILATFAITPWAFVGFGTIPQEAEEFNFSFKKVNFIMVVAILFGCFVYVSNNTVAAAALTNWPERVLAGEWVLLVAAEELLGVFGKILVGLGVSGAVLSGMLGFYLASSRLMYSMAREGYFPKIFGKLDKKYSTPKNAMIFCTIISLSGPILGREALGWFVDMSSIGASIGYFFTCSCALITAKRDGDGTKTLRFLATTGCVFAIIFMALQLIPIPGLSGVHFCTESYIMFAAWIVLGLVFYIKQRKHFGVETI